MKTKFLITSITAVIFIAFPAVNVAQAPNLGSAADYVLFSSVGAIGNTGISQVTGNVGTNVGAISGFGNINGVVHNADAATIQAKADLLAAWSYLANLAPTSAHGPVLGGGETLFAGVDTLAAAGSIVGVLNLDAQGNPNAVFIIKTGGALTTAASATVNLINGAVACNVFWVAEGAISMATMTVMKGTLISHNGAVDMGAGGIIEGRLLSTAGAVSIYGTHADMPLGCGRPILTGPVAPNLASTECYALFSSNGIVSNSGSTAIKGDVATNQGYTTGYNPATVMGTIHPVPDGYTAQCAIDLKNVDDYLQSLPFDIELLYPAQFGNNLTLTPHTYRMNAAAVFTDTLYLDAQGNTDAIFVIQIVGALSTGTFSKVALINGTQAKNVYWDVQGAVIISDNSVFSGNIICHSGAVTLNTGVSLDGRAFTTSGALTTTAMTATISSGGLCIVTLPIKLTSFTGVCNKKNIILNWNTASEKNNGHVAIERSSDGITWQAIGKVDAAGNSAVPHAYSFVDNFSSQNTAYYRLLATGPDGLKTYSFVVAVAACGSPVENVAIYPNPSSGKFVLSYMGDKTSVVSTEIFNAIGEKVYSASGFQTDYDLSNLSQGVYILQLHLRSKIYTKQIVIRK